MYKIALLIFCCLFAPVVHAQELLLIAHPSLNADKLTKKELVNIYMGQTNFLNNGQRVLPIDLKSDSQAKKIFYKWLVNKNINDINAYWARLLFSGRSKPPYAVNGAEDVIYFVKNNPSAIGYITHDSKHTLEAVRILKVIK